MRAIIDGTAFEGWTAFSVSRSIETLAARFSLGATSAASLPVSRGAEIALEIIGQRVLTGYVDVVEAAIDETTHEITLSGRDKTADLVDASAVVDAQEMRDATLREIVETVVKPFGLEAVFDIGGVADEVFQRFSFQEESAYEAIERACRLRGVMATSDEMSRVVVATPGRQRATGSLEMGPSLTLAKMRLDNAGRFSSYLVYGQQPGGDYIDPAVAAGPSGAAFDAGVNRYRPKIILAEGAVDDDYADRRAQWESAVRAARATTVQVTVRGWSETVGGELWRVGRLVRTRIPPLRIDRDMIARDVAYILDGSGARTTLTLVEPGVYTPLPERQSAGDIMDEWSITFFPERHR